MYIDAWNTCVFEVKELHEDLSYYRHNFYIRPTGQMYCGASAVFASGDSTLTIADGSIIANGGITVKKSGITFSLGQTLAITDNNRENVALFVMNSGSDLTGIPSDSFYAKGGFATEGGVGIDCTTNKIPMPNSNKKLIFKKGILVGLGD